MKIILIFGPQAVGKMTIGEQVGKSLNLPLLHNHVTLDAIWPYIGWNNDTFELSTQLRMGIFNHISNNESHPVIIFTFVWSFDNEDDWNNVEEIKRMFNKPSHEIYFVELSADLNERLKRNKSENRLEKKPSKRDIEFSESELRNSVKKHRLNSNEGEIKENNYLRLDVTELSVQESSQLIVDWIKGE